MQHGPHASVGERRDRVGLGAARVHVEGRVLRGAGEHPVEDDPLLAQRGSPLARAVEPDLADVVGLVDQFVETTQRRGIHLARAQRMSPQGQAGARVAGQKRRPPVEVLRCLGHRHADHSSRLGGGENATGMLVPIEVHVRVEEHLLALVRGVDPRDPSALGPAVADGQ